ncbi:hypothetical protein ANCCAN_20857 [Ancylostoma caninum]|uniref:Uncharacterized protein n=1 Tax=Ancylostoma caninum TaxID=29170 RepID=A0A368FR59_ANCCA|nr:hypothetical protein ANCCAN_20857 [Ancylostoma caninum]
MFIELCPTIMFSVGIFSAVFHFLSITSSSGELIEKLPDCKNYSGDYACPNDIRAALVTEINTKLPSKFPKYDCLLDEAAGMKILLNDDDIWGKMYPNLTEAVETKFEKREDTIELDFNKFAREAADTWSSTLKTLVSY